MNSMSQIVSQGELSFTDKLGNTDTGQLGPANSTGALHRLCPQSQPVISTPTYSSTSGQACAGDSGGAGTPTESGNSRIMPPQPEFCFPNVSGRKEGGRPMPSNKPEKSSKPICASRALALQDGGLTPSIRQRDWMIKMDFKDAYFQILIQLSHQHCLHFTWEGKHYNSKAFLLASPLYHGCLPKHCLAKTDRLMPDSLSR